MHDKYKTKALVIHVKGARQRQDNIERLRKQLPYPLEVIDAASAHSLTKKQVDKVYRRHLLRPAYPFRLSKNEIACFLSHRLAWSRIVEQKLDFGLILEDDACLKPDFLSALSLVYEHASLEDFIRFPIHLRETGQRVAQKNHLELFKPRRVGHGQVAQLVGWRAAKKLLERTTMFDRPVDTFLQLFWHTGIRPMAIHPVVVNEISDELGGSLRKAPLSLSHRLRRELLRPLYRCQVAYLSKKNAH